MTLSVTLREKVDASAAEDSCRHASVGEDRTQVMCSFGGEIGEAPTAFVEKRQLTWKRL